MANLANELTLPTLLMPNELTLPTSLMANLANLAN